MALLFMDGFDGSDFSTKWTVSGFPTAITSPVRFAFTGSRAVSGSNSGGLFKTIPETAQLTVGLAYYVGGANEDVCFFYSNAGASQQLTVHVNASLQLTVYRGSSGGTLLATGTTALVAGTWHYIEFQATLNATTGTAIIHLDGNNTPEISFTGNTQNAAYTTFDQVGLQCQNGAAIDDVYIADGTGSHNNSFLGDVRVYPLSPSGAGASSQFTPTGAATGWQATDALPVQSTTYVSDGTSGQADLYTLGALPAGVSAVLGVQTNVYMAKSDAGAIQGKGLIRAGGTTFNGAPRSVSTTYATYSDVYDQNPNTVAPWAVSDIASLQAGVGVV